MNNLTWWQKFRCKFGLHKWKWACLDDVCERVTCRWCGKVVTWSDD